MITALANFYLAPPASWGTINPRLKVWSAGADYEVGEELLQAARRRSATLVWVQRVGLAISAVLTSFGAAEAAGAVSVEKAWVAPNDAAGVDVGLFMTIKNDGDQPDALIRAACPFANFSEKRTMDVGEGGLSARSVPNIPVAAHSSLTLTAKTYHIGLLQTRDPLKVGDSFTCNLSFRGAGPMEVQVTVSPNAP